MEHRSAILLRRLNPYCARALEAAASLCRTRAHAFITPEHWLLKLLEQGEGDITVIARRYELDMDGLWQALLAHLETLPRSVRERPQLAENLVQLLQQAWLAAATEDNAQIRGVHLLMALVDKSSLLNCDGLWPLLSVGRTQLERLRPLLDGQSDERPEIQQEAALAQVAASHEPQADNAVAPQQPGLSPALQGVLDKFTLDVTAKARN
ncbi:type VI secretion system ATPase TssH, partial [Salmonella enterica subsp. enterica]|nr:type VI secretion system ATPase TssH [Salmonella enterica subsp. enterica]